MLTLSSMSQEQARAVKPDKAANQSKALAPPAGRDSPERRPQNAPAPLLLAGERKESGIEGRLERRHVALRLRFRWRCRIHPRGQRREQHDRQRRQIKSSSAAAPPVPPSRAAACWWCHRTAASMAQPPAARRLRSKAAGRPAQTRSPALAEARYFADLRFRKLIAPEKVAKHV